MAQSYQQHVQITRPPPEWHEDILHHIAPSPPHSGSNTSSLQQQTSPPVAQAPPLPSNKLYHVFFSYSSQDRDWVLKTIQRLEGPPLGLKCCFDERDFELGVPVMQNIVTSIHSSLKTVVVLSPSFVTSAWCSYEARIVLEMDLETRRRLLVPIMLQDCTVPHFIGRLTHIRVDSEHFWERFISALCCTQSLEPGQTGLLTRPTLQFNPHYTNGQIVVRLKSKRIQLAHQFRYNYMPDELTSRGISVPIGDYRRVVKGINYQLNDSLPCTWFLNISAAIVLTVWFLLPLVSLAWVGSPRKYPMFLPFLSFDGDISNLAAFVVFVLFVPFWIMAAVLWNHRQKSKLMQTMFQANLTFARHNLLLHFENNSLIFIFYDIKTCITNLSDSLVNLDHGNPREQDLTEEEITQRKEEAVHRVLSLHLWEYLTLLVEGRLPWPRTQRHTSQAKCLCQFMQQKL